ncbi:MAG: amino acid adenylation domain-containing protein, partial [Cyanobacteria bacterium J06598_1]
MVLKRLSDAERDGDRVVAVIKGSAINHDGRTNGIAAPNSLSQQALIKEAIANAGHQPADVDYIEAHGTGTSLGDPIEFKAIRSTLLNDRADDQRCWIGSVKTNIGHLEAAAGIASLIKVVLSLQHEAIPPNLHFNQSNQYISLDNTPLGIPTTIQPWSIQEKERVAGINGYSFGGTNCHLVVAEAPRKKTPDRVIAEHSTPSVRPFLLSAKRADALIELAKRYETFLATNASDPDSAVALADVCFTANTGRAHYKHRLAIATESTAHLKQQLSHFVQGQQMSTVKHQVITGGLAPKVAFLFSGQGSQYINMGRELYESSPKFRACLERCDRILRPHLDCSIIDVIYRSVEAHAEEKLPLIDQTSYTQPCLFSLEYALAQQWLSWGIRPSVVMGHSLGEYVAACVAGAFTLEDALPLIATRARLMDALPQTGQMVAVFAPELAVKAALAAAGSSVVISAVNSPQSVVISGENQAVEQMANLFTQQQIEVRSLAVSQAFHSPLIAPMVDSLGEALKQVTIQPLRLPLASSLTGEVFGKGHILTTDYWQQHTLGAVRFMDGLNSVINQKCRVVIEIGPHPVLSRQGQRCNLDPAPHWLPSLVKQQGDWCNLSKSLAALYTYGVAVNWNAFEAKLPGERLCLPTYPFKRQSYWVKNANLPHYPYLSNTAPISGAAPTLQAVNTANGRGPYDHRNGHGHRNDNSHHNGNGHRNGSAPQHLQTQLVTPIEPPATVQLGPSVSQRKQTRKECILLHLQGQLAQMLRLDPSDIDVHDSLVEMGADSISLLEMVHALEATYGISFSMTELFRFSHLAAIAEHLDTTLAATWEMPGERAMATPEVTMDQPLASEIAQLSAQLSAQQLSAQQLSAQQISMTAWAIDERPHPPELTATVALLKQQLETLSQVMTAQMDTLNRVTGNERSSILPESLQQPAPSLSPDDAVGGHGFSQGKNKVQAQKQPQEQAQKQPQKQSEEKPLTVTFAARNRPLQLSHPQERLWFLAQLEGPSATYNIPVVLKIEGVLDRTAFEQSIQAIVDRHESLRTSFTTQNDQPIQQVHAAIDWGIKTVDLRADKIPMATAAKLIQTEVERPFDLTRLPLFRVTLIRIDELTTVLVFTIHHIISDAWSMGRVFVEELRQGYGDRIGHKAVNNNGHQPSGEARLPLRVQYADFAQWHRSWLQGPAGERQLSYWKTQLADLPSCLELPTDYPRPKVKTYQGDTVHQVIPPALVTQLTQLSQSSGVTLFMTLLSAYGLLLSRYSGQRDIVIGSPLVNRPYPELTPLIGFFLNTLALRLRLSPQSSFQTLLTHVKEQTLMAYDHPDVPFEEIVRALQLPRNTSHTPLFQTMFVFQNVAEETVDFPGLQMTPMKVNVKVSKFDLTLWLSQTDGQIRAEWEYSTDLFKASSIERMATHFQQLLESLVETPQCPISALSLIPAQEQQWLSQWGNHSWHNANQFTQGALAPDHLQQPIYEQIAAQAKKTPGAIALEWNQQTLTYAALDQQANQLAHYLTELGVTPGQRVGLCLPRSFALIVSILGILKVGAAYVPLDPNYPQARLDYIVTDAQLQALISLESTLSEKFAAAGDADYQLICYDRDREKITAQPTTCPVRPISTEGAIDNSQLAYLIYTSGSTGQPKGVAVGHSALSNFVQGAISHYGFIPSDRTLQFASISFDAAAEEIFPTLCVGATLVLRPNNMVASLGEFLRSCNELQLSILDLPTAYWQQLVGELTNTQNPAPKQTLPDQLRLVIIGGEKVSSESVRLWQQHMGTEPDSAATRITLLNTYGPTEATVVTTAYRIPNSLPDGDREIAVSTNVLIGKPLPNVEVYVLDSALQPVPIGVPGELYIGGAGLAQGYFNRPELTAKAFIPHPFSQQPGARLYKSGDRVRYQENGELAYLDRIDNQVKIRGFRIELGEVESVLAVLPQVKDVIVVTQTSEQGDRRLVAYVVAPADTAPAALRQHVKDQLPDYMVPTVFMVLDTFPLTPSGKVDRRNLPMPDQSDLRQGERYVAPQTPIECKLVEIVQTLLSLEKVGVEDDFFTIGGHSLLATQLMLKVQTEFQVDIPLTVLFETPTLANLAQHIEGHTNHQPASAAPEDAAPSAVVVSALDAKSSKPETLLGTRPIPVIERDRNSIPLSYAQQRLWFLQALEPESTAYTLPGGIRLQGRLNPTALERALATIVERHEALRTTFDYQDGRPVQRIEPSGTWMLSSTDFSDLDSTAQAKALEKLIEKTVQQPFDLTRDALLRCQLVTLSAQDHVLLFCTHHISSDGWSINLLLRELVTLYEDFCAGRAASLPLLPIQYADFTVWQREWLQGEVLQQQLDYWQKQLEGAPALLELPTDRPRPAVQTVNGARLYHRLPHDLTEQLDQLSQRVGGTLFMVLLTGFNLLLSRYSSQLDISVGSTIANRP